MCAAMLYGLLVVVVILLLQVCFPIYYPVFYQLCHLCICDFPQSLCNFVFF